MTAALDATPGPVLWSSNDLELLWGNVAAEDTFGWDRDHLVGFDPLAKVHPDDLTEALDSTRTLTGCALFDVQGGRAWRR